MVSKPFSQLNMSQGFCVFFCIFEILSAPICPFIVPPKRCPVVSRAVGLPTFTEARSFRSSTWRWLRRNPRPSRRRDPPCLQQRVIPLDVAVTQNSNKPWASTTFMRNKKKKSLGTPVLRKERKERKEQKGDKPRNPSPEPEGTRKSRWNTMEQNVKRLGRQSPEPYPEPKKSGHDDGTECQNVRNQKIVMEQNCFLEELRSPFSSRAVWGTNTGTLAGTRK